MKTETEREQCSEPTSAATPLVAAPRTETLKSNLGGVDIWTADALSRREAARCLGQVRSERKAAAVRENGKKGGRPRGTKTSDEAKAKMQQAQQKRRAREQASEAQIPKK